MTDGFKGIVVLNDEAHHCYREKPDSDEEVPARSARKPRATTRPPASGSPAWRR